MRIGILTLHYIPNMGAVLQAYATQKVLHKTKPFHEFDVEIIDYRSEDREAMYDVKSTVKYTLKKRSLKDFLLLPRKLASYYPMYKLRMTLLKFYKNEMRLSKTCNKRDIKEYCERYQAIIVGSDQVWNPNLEKGDNTYLLDFYDGIKLSYASSIGLVQIPDEQKCVYKRYLSLFSIISCREKRGKEIVEEIVRNEAYEVLDPTLLISKKEWCKFAEKSKLHIDKTYALVYVPKFSQKINDFAEKIKREKKIDIIYVSTPIVEKNYKSNDCISCMKPYDWVYLIKNATYIITNSFHGIAFSINLNKQVFIEDNPPNCLSASRIQNIVDNFNLHQRVIPDNYHKCSIDAYQELDFISINTELEKRRRESMKYINKMAEVICKKLEIYKR